MLPFFAIFLLSITNYYSGCFAQLYGTSSLGVSTTGQESLGFGFGGGGGGSGFGGGGSTNNPYDNNNNNNNNQNSAYKQGQCQYSSNIQCLAYGQNQCNGDRQCSGQLKCCYNSCGYGQCSQPQSSTGGGNNNIKPGQCPNPTMFVCTLIYQNPQCYTDANCYGSQKCCSNGCVNMCQNPQQQQGGGGGGTGGSGGQQNPQKPGMCPYSAPGTIGTCIARCTSDYNCPGYQKCCSNGCGTICKHASY